MASALTIKSGGTWTVKSGGTVAIKDAGLPPYVISGLEQSHWNVANATVNAYSQVVSIPDESGVQDLTPETVPSIPTPIPLFGKYSATGWQLNGKTLPLLSAEDPESGKNYPCLYRADQWASKLSSYDGAYTVAVLLKPNWTSLAARNSIVCAVNKFSDSNMEVQGPMLDTNNTWTFRRRVSAQYQAFEDGTATKVPTLVVAEYRGTSFSGANVAWKLWINGTSQSLSAAFTGSPGSGNFDKFFVMGQRDSSNPNGRLWYQGSGFAQFHIWKGALTDQQRTDVTAYLKSISGIA